jgi:hypothetical protein
MKKLLLTTALLALAAPAYAGNITVVNVHLPDGDALNSVQTDGYGYYTGPIDFTLPDSTNLEVYCADLNHILKSTGTYAMVPLTINGLGNPISQFTSEKIGLLALLGFSQNLGTTAGQDEAAAIQAEIWDLEYGVTSTFTNPTGEIATDWAALQTLVTLYKDVPGEYATALDPVGEGWWKNADASQQMIMGLGSSVPELSTWSMGLIGFGIFGLGGLYKTRKAPRYAL